MQSAIQSFPILIIIALYEKYSLAPSSFLHSTQSVAQLIYNVLPRPLKSIPILESLMGADVEDIYEALFNVEMDLDNDQVRLFSDEEDDHVGLRSWISREDGGGPGNDVHPPTTPTTPAVRTHTMQTTVRHRAGPSSNPRSPHGSPRPRPRVVSMLPSLTEPARAGAPEIPSFQGSSPLGRLFTGRFTDLPDSAAVLRELSGSKKGCAGSRSCLMMSAGYRWRG